MESLEPSADERPTEDGRKGREEVHATRTGGRELEQRGSLPAKQSPESGWQKRRGRTDCVLTASAT